jgi:hypothetical protein
MTISSISKKALNQSIFSNILIVISLLLTSCSVGRFNRFAIHPNLKQGDPSGYIEFFSVTNSFYWGDERQNFLGMYTIKEGV